MTHGNPWRDPGFSTWKIPRLTAIQVLTVGGLTVGGLVHFASICYNANSMKRKNLPTPDHLAPHLDRVAA